MKDLFPVYSRYYFVFDNILSHGLKRFKTFKGLKVWFLLNDTLHVEVLLLFSKTKFRLIKLCNRLVRYELSNGFTNNFFIVGISLIEKIASSDCSCFSYFLFKRPLKNILFHLDFSFLSQDIKFFVFFLFGKNLKFCDVINGPNV